MTNQDNLKLVFTGSVVDASFIKSILEENKIECMVRDSLTESVHAGWASGTPTTSNRVFVAIENETQAKKLIDEFLKSNETQS